MKIIKTSFIILFCSITIVQQNKLYSKDDKTIIINSIPATVSKFIGMRNKIAVTPEGGATMMLVAMMIQTKDQELGLKCLTIALDKRNIMKGDVYKGYKPGSSIMWHIKRLTSPRMVYVPYAYVEGADKNNRYRVDLPYKFNFFRNKYTTARKGLMRIMIKCYGAAFPRPVTMRKNKKGIWKVYECSSLFLGVVKPVEDVDDDL